MSSQQVETQTLNETRDLDSKEAIDAVEQKKTTKSMFLDEDGNPMTYFQMRMREEGL